MSSLRRRVCACLGNWKEHREQQGLWSNPEDDGIVEGASLQISAYVKDHQVNKYNGGKETIVNRIKVLRIGDK